jgi:hypothetical protein
MSDLQPGVDPDLEADELGRFQLTFSYILGHPRLGEALQAVASAPAGEGSLDASLTDVMAGHGIELPPGSTVRYTPNDAVTAEDSDGGLFVICVFVGDHMVCVQFNSPITIQ